MKTDMPHKLLEQVMRDNIDRDIPYTIDIFYLRYKQLLKREKYQQKYRVMGRSSFKKRLGEWSQPGMFLIKKGRGEKAIYHKRVVHRSNISAADLKKRANDILSCVKGRIPSWAKW